MLPSLLRQVAPRGALATLLAAQPSAALATQALTPVDLVEKAKEVATTLRQDSPEIVLPGQAVVGDYRSTSALSLGDGITNHTAKWLQKELGVSCIFTAVCLLSRV
jgi:hypothetical protein